MSNIIEMIWLAFGSLLIVASLSLFATNQQTLESMYALANQSSSSSTSYRTDSSDIYVSEVEGHEMIVQIMSDPNSIRFIVNDAGGYTLIDITDCVDMSLLTSINEGDIYDVSRTYVGNRITEVTYEAR